MSFLDKIGKFGESFINGLNDQVATGENTPRGLDTLDPNDPNRVIAYGALGKFAEKIDSTASRTYVESGYIRNIKPRFFEVLLQEPDLTIVIKKKMFSSLINNYKYESMDEAERNFVKASKRLFQNKCQVISIYEKLTKIERIIENRGFLDDYLTPLLVSGVEALEAFGINIVSPKTKIILDTINRLKSFSEPSSFTTWITDPSAPYTMGEGVGVFELTLVSSVNTTCSTALGGGNASLQIEDPYKLMNITNEDIDHAIADVLNIKQASQLFQFSEDELAKQNNQLLQTLNRSRKLRGAPEINIKVNDNSIIYKRIRAFYGDKEVLFTFNPGVFGIGAKAEIDPSALEGRDGLNSSDEDQLSTIIKNTYLILNLKQQKEMSYDDVLNKENRDQARYIREKMRLQFANKNIIQAMDTIHVFISSKTIVDNKAIGVDKSSITSPGNNLLSMLNSSINKLEQSFNNLNSFFGGSRAEDNFVEIEKEAIVGADFPTWLWVAMRNDFTRQAAGTHVFGGVVVKVDSNYSNGKYILNVSCSDNTYYFRMGEINLSPADAPIDREIYDPYTPFNLEFDASTGFLLGETPELLPENNSLLFSGAVKIQNGSRFLNSPLTNFLYGIGDIDNRASSIPQKIFFDPEGFVYRWKSGIGTLTFEGPKHPPSFERERTSRKLTSNAFAGQDVMNVLSLLITGQPYNYNNFINSAIDNGALAINSRDDLNNSEIAATFFRSLLSDLQLNNLAWGNFIPFKKLLVNENGLNFLILGQFSIKKSSKEISRVLETRAKLFDELVQNASDYAGNPNITQKSIFGDPISSSPIEGDLNIPGKRDEIATSLALLSQQDEKLAQLEEQLLKSIEQSNTADGTLQIFGDDFALAENINEGVNTESERLRQREEFRRKLKYLTLRRLWKVKSNEDHNLLIVDDQYDKDYDIQAFERALNGKAGLFKSEYSDIFNHIANISNILGLEVFADTQGHIQIKPPGYNKMPSSVFERMIRDKKRLYPKALESLFVNQIEGLTQRLEIIEDEIRLRAIALGFTDDSDIEKYLSGSGTQIGTGTFVFKFISSEKGFVSEKPFAIRSLVQQDSPDLREDAEYKALKQIDISISGQLRQQGLFGTSTQIRQSIFNTDIFQSNKNINNRYDQISRRLMQKKGMQTPSLSQLISTDRYKTQTDVLKITKEISSFVSERQQIMKKLRNGIRNIDQGLSINKDINSQKSILWPDLNNSNKTEFPSAIAHMIEDETEDDLGPGSGGRYIIKENQIISMTISETPPDFTVVEVNGLFGEGFTGSLPAGFEMGRSGNALVSAIGVDYDLWRMYGFKVSQSRPAPFISNPESQAAPLATWMLSEQRRKIISGNIVIAGNEYMQPGEVVYIEDRDLLFYVESVSHSFTYGSNFTTTLQLTYGHNPGEYFPTMLDIVGKGLYSKQFNSNLVKNIKNERADGYQHIGVIVADSAGPARINDPFAINNLEMHLVEGSYGSQNRKTLTNLILTLKGINTPNSNVKPTIEVRYYYNSKKGFGQNSAPGQFLNGLSQSIIDWLKNPTSAQLGFSGIGDTLQKKPKITEAVGGLFNKKESSSIIPDNLTDGLRLDNIDNSINIIGVDLGSDTETRSPSKRAWLASRETAAGTSSVFGEVEDITKQSNKKQENNPLSSLISEERALYNNVIDIWVRFDDISKTDETNRLNEAGTASQAKIEEAQRIIEASQ